MNKLGIYMLSTIESQEYLESVLGLLDIDYSWEDKKDGRKIYTFTCTTHNYNAVKAMMRAKGHC